MNIKKEYVAPIMTTMTVELECGFMKASIVDDLGKGTDVTSTAQDYQEFSGNSFGGTKDNSGQISWDQW